MNSTLDNLRQTIETILRCNLSEAIGVSDKAEAEKLVQRFLHAVSDRMGGQSDQIDQDSEQLARQIDPHSGLSSQPAKEPASIRPAV